MAPFLFLTVLTFSFAQTTRENTGNRSIAASAYDLPENAGPSNKINYSSEILTVKKDIRFEKRVPSYSPKDEIRTNPPVSKIHSDELQAIKRMDARGDIYFSDFQDDKQESACEMTFSTIAVESDKSNSEKMAKILSSGLTLKSTEKKGEIFEYHPKGTAHRYSRLFEVFKNGKIVGKLMLDCSFDRQEKYVNLRARYESILQKIGFVHQGVDGPVESSKRPEAVPPKYKGSR